MLYPWPSVVGEGAVTVSYNPNDQVEFKEDFMIKEIKHWLFID